jgi:hypothetical protein
MLPDSFGSDDEIYTVWTFRWFPALIPARANV